MAFMSTLVTYGRGVGVAVETGMNSQIGKIATLLHEADDDMTPLQKKLSTSRKVFRLCCCSYLYRDVSHRLFTRTRYTRNVYDCN